MERFTRLTVAATVLMLLACGVILLPLATLDAQTVRRAVERELTLRTGLKATILGRVDISVFGGPSVVFGRVTLVNGSGNISADVTDMTVAIRYLSALTQTPSISRIEMTGPRLTVAEPADGKSFWTPDRQSVEMLVAGLSLESLTITNGRIIILRQPSGIEIVDAVDLEATRREGGRNIAIRGDLTWRGNRIAANGEIGDIDGLLQGDRSSASLAAKSPLGSASIAGDLTLSPTLQWDGRIAAETANIRKMLGWLAPKWTGNPVFASLAVSGTGKLEAARLRVDRANVTLSGATGQGTVEVNWSEARPKLLGTLAFDAVSLTPEKLAERPDKGAGSPQIDFTFLPIDIARVFDLDLRFSASTLSVPPIAAADIGATLLSGGDRLTFEVAGANVLGGTGRLSFEIEGLSDIFAARLRADGRNLDLSGLLAALGRDKTPQGRLSGNGELSIRGVMPQASTGSMEGIFDATLEAPRWKGGDLRAALEAAFRQQGKPPDPLPALPADLSRLAIKAKFDSQHVTLASVDVQAPRFRAKLGGEMTLPGFALALKGVAEFHKEETLPSQSEVPAALSLPLKVGGTPNGLTIEFPEAKW